MCAHEKNYLQKGLQKKTPTSTKKKDGADTKATTKKVGASTKATEKKVGADAKAKAATQANDIYHVVWLATGCLL